MTREEGVWIIPGLVLLFLVLPATWPGRAKTILIVGISALLVYGSVGLVNMAAYGKWIFTELDGGAFPSAMKALQRVDVGNSVAHVPVTREARNQIYRVSPTFASIADYIERPEISQLSCGLLPHTCGEIAGGWFLWVFRDAAQNAGVFSDPAKANAFFIEIANEVNSACERSLLHCRPNPLLNIPRIESRELSQIPLIILGALRRAIFLEAPLMESVNSFGPEPMVFSASNFLNRPNVQPVNQDSESFNYRNSNRSLAYLKLRIVMSASYAWILHAVVFLGSISLIILTAMLWRNLPFLIKFSWIFIIFSLTRIVLLSLVEVTSFPATSLYYLGPVPHLIAVSAVLSLYVSYEKIKAMPFSNYWHFKNKD